MARRLAQSNGFRLAVRHAIALLLIAVLGSGCSAWNRFAPPRDGFASSEKDRFRLTLDDQKKIQVRGLRVEGDTLRFVPGKGADSLTALPWRSVVGYEERKFDPVATVITIAAIGAVGYFGLLFYVAATGGFSLATQPTHPAPDAPPPAPPSDRDAPHERGR